jgi:ubiquinol-cytochrome c reductase iron-sulfur subunit
LTYGNWRGAQAQRTANPCVPAGLAWWFFCPCHASTIDFAERVIKYQPAPSHLVVPPLPDLTTMHLLAGEDDNGLV